MGPTGPAGWSFLQRSPEHCDHPLQPLAGASGARFAVTALSPSSVAGYRYAPSHYPPTHTPPWYTPVPHPRPDHDMHG